MANYCFARYAIEGNKEPLDKIATAISENCGDAKSTLEALDIKYDEDRW